MKYLLLKGGTKAEFEAILKWPKRDVEAHFAYMRSLSRQIRESGELVATAALGAPGEACVVRAGAEGVPITDGVFPESKEYLAGYWLIEVDRPERAFEIAALASAAPGLGGGPGNDRVELRRVLDDAVKDCS